MRFYSFTYIVQPGSATAIVADQTLGLIEE
jgi:hypothetical protein